MRSPGDSWDIVSSVGRTALEVATFRAVETDRRDRIISDDFARMFVEAAREQELIGMLANPSVLDDSYIPKVIGPRTKFFDDFLQSATTDGLPQVVIAAAGLDARAFRLDLPNHTIVYEIDKPAVLEFKNNVLQAQGAQPTVERRCVAVDLREDWPAALTATGFDTQTPTAWIAEGLLMYLPGAAQDAFFNHIDSLSVPASQLASHSTPRGAALQRMQDFAQSDTPGAHRPQFDLWYDDQRTEPDQWLEERGWQVEGISAAELFTRCGRPVPQSPSRRHDRRHYWTAIKP